MPRNIDVGLLRSFHAVVEAGSVTGASRLLNLTQAAVSLQLKRLEEMLGARLLERGNRGIRLTPPGERLIGQARQMLRGNDEIWASMSVPEFDGDVLLGMPSDLIRPFGTELLRRFDRAWPRVRVTIVCDTSGRLLQRVDHGEVDVAIIVQPDGGGQGETLRVDRLVWVGARHGTAHLRNPLPLSTGDDTCPHRPIALEALEKAGRGWRFVCEIASFEAICAPVEADIAVSPMLTSTVPDSLKVIDEKEGLPRLADFRVKLYLPPAGAPDVAVELARHIREMHAAARAKLGAGEQSHV